MMPQSKIPVGEFHKYCRKRYPLIGVLSIIDQLDDKGYHSVTVKDNHHEWHRDCQWCEKHCGALDYTCIGNIFWFTRSKDSLLFSIAWGT